MLANLQMILCGMLVPPRRGLPQRYYVKSPQKVPFGRWKHKGSISPFIFLQQSKSNVENKEQKYKFQFQQNTELAKTSTHDSDANTAKSSGVLAKVPVELRVASHCHCWSQRRPEIHFSNGEGANRGRTKAPSEWISDGWDGRNK